MKMPSRTYRVKDLANIVVAFAVLTTPVSAWAFKLNPCLRVLVNSYNAPSQEGILRRNLCTKVLPENYKQTVHEHMTYFAITKYRGGFKPLGTFVKGDSYPTRRHYYMDQKPWSMYPGTQKHLTSAIIYGSWWNDDPLMYMWGSGPDFIGGALNLNSVIHSSETKPLPGGIAGCEVPREQHLGWNSHFGKLQYLHFMTNLVDATNQQVTTTTTDSALKWIKYAYSVALRDIKPDDPLTEELEQSLNLPPICENYCLNNKNNVKTRTLFARAGMQLDHRNDITPDVALGSILHILQDSFSPAHTCRIEEKSNGQVLAKLVNVYNYNTQVEKEHSKRDAYPDWLITYLNTGEHTYANDPIIVSAWVLEAVDKRVPWSDVESHLRTTIFAAAEDTSITPKCIGINR